MGATRPPSLSEALVRRLVAVLIELIGPRLAGVLLLIVALLTAGLVFIPTSIALVIVDSVLHPTESVAGPIAIVWFVGSVVALFVILVRLYRWLTLLTEAPTRVARIVDPSLVSGSISDDDAVRRAEARAAAQASLASRLAASDARLAVGNADTDTDSQAPAAPDVTR